MSRKKDVNPRASPSIEISERLRELIRIVYADTPHRIHILLAIELHVDRLCKLDRILDARQYLSEEERVLELEFEKLKKEKRQKLFSLVARLVVPPLISVALNLAVNFYL
jgi:hypothetical protein